jgi:hypothetical protein
MLNTSNQFWIKGKVSVIGFGRKSGMPLSVLFGFYLPYFLIVVCKSDAIKEHLPLISNILAEQKVLYCKQWDLTDFEQTDDFMAAVFLRFMN